MNYIGIVHFGRRGRQALEAHRSDLAVLARRVVRVAQAARRGVVAVETQDRLCPILRRRGKRDLAWPAVAEPLL